MSNLEISKKELADIKIKCLEIATANSHVGDSEYAIKESEKYLEWVLRQDSNKANTSSME